MPYPNATNYSENFTRAELDCHCGCTTPPDVAINLQNLAVHLEKLRELHGGPLTIDDGYRCPAENARVGGVRNSQHLQGKAADVSAENIGVHVLAELAAQEPSFNAGGIGIYPAENFVHVDYRVGAARWTD